MLEERGEGGHGAAHYGDVDFNNAGRPQPLCTLCGRELTLGYTQWPGSR